MGPSVLRTQIGALEGCGLAACSQVSPASVEMWSPHREVRVSPSAMAMTFAVARVYRDHRGGVSSGAGWCGGHLHGGIRPGGAVGYRIRGNGQPQRGHRHQEDSNCHAPTLRPDRAWVSPDDISAGTGSLYQYRASAPTALLRSGSFGNPGPFLGAFGPPGGAFPRSGIEPRRGILCEASEYIFYV